MKSTKTQPQSKFPTPTGKLSPLSSTKVNLVLALTGSFFPIHNNHIRTLEKVKEHLTDSPTYNLIGGYIIPTHNSNLQKKLNNNFIAPVKRLEMYQLAVADSTWIDVDPFLLMQSKNIGAEQAKIHLESFLKEELIKKDGEQSEENLPVIKVVPVMGVDNIALVEKRISKDFFIFVQNRPSLSQFDTDAWLNSEKVKPYIHNVIIVKDLDIPYEISSTLLRERIAKDLSVDQYFPAKVCELFQSDPTFKTVFKKIAQELVQQGPSIKEYGLSYNNPVEPVKTLFDFPFETIPFEDLEPELLYGQPQKLGKGLAGAVWAMKWKGIPVAVKIFDLSSQRSRRIGSMKLELRSLSRINHKNVVKSFGAGTIGNGIYIVLERAETINIWSYFTENQNLWTEKGYNLEWIEAWAELAEGCEAMAQAGVYHRDLQLDNILLFKEKIEEKCENGKEESKEEVKEDDKKNSKTRVVFKVTDFGVSSLEIDKHTVIRGSMRHYSPEAIDAKENYSSAADVYSFGLLLYEMIHAKRVWSTLATPDSIGKVLAGERPICEVPCHEEVKKVMEACWAHEAAKRLTFKEVAEMLHKVPGKILEGKE